MLTGLPQSTGEGYLACGILNVTGYTHFSALLCTVCNMSVYMKRQDNKTKTYMLRSGVPPLPIWVRSWSPSSTQQRSCPQPRPEKRQPIGGRMSGRSHTRPIRRPLLQTRDREKQSVWYIQHTTNEIIFLKCSWALERHHVWIMTAHSFTHTHQVFQQLNDQRWNVLSRVAHLCSQIAQIFFLYTKTAQDISFIFWSEWVKKLRFLWLKKKKNST